ncbi:MAG: hypothetical protein V4444_07820 [Pseudomonadota bacterium]
MAQAQEKPCSASPLILATKFLMTGTKSVNNPPVNVPSEAEIGEVILTAQRAKIYRDSIVLSHPVEFRGIDLKRAFTIRIPAGELPAESSNQEGGYYLSPTGTITFDKDGTPHKNLSVGIKLPVGDVGPTSLFYWNRRGHVEYFPALLSGVTPIVCIQADPDYLRRELLYSGVAQNIVTLSYREIEKGLLRPAFSQELKFDLTQGREVGFRGARLRIIEASNTIIRYEILKPLE